MDISITLINKVIKPFTDTVSYLLSNIMTPMIRAITSAIDPITAAFQALISPISNIVQILVSTIVDPFIGENGVFTRIVRGFTDYLLTPITSFIEGFMNEVTKTYIDPLAKKMIAALTPTPEQLTQLQAEEQAINAVTAAQQAEIAQSPGVVAAKQAEGAAAKGSIGAYFGEAGAKLVSSAAALPFPLNIVAMGVIMALFTALISAIMRPILKMFKFHKGGEVGKGGMPLVGGKEVLAVLEKGEIVLPKDVAGSLLEFFTSISKTRSAPAHYQEGGIVAAPSSSKTFYGGSIYVEEGAVKIYAQTVDDKTIKEAAGKLWDEIEWRQKLKESAAGNL